MFGNYERRKQLVDFEEN